MPLDSPAQRAALRTAIFPDGSIYEANAEAMHFYTRPAESAAARTYLQHRGINPSNIPGQYVIGYVMEPYVPDAVHTDPLPGVRAAGGHVFEAVSIEDLSRQLFDEYGVPAVQAAATIREFNDSWHSNDPSRLSVPRREGLHACEQAPFYAVPVRPGITFTEGGVRADPDCQALDDIGLPIPGLYVAGVDVGAVSIEGYVGGLAAGLMTGLRAGVNAARYADQAAQSGQRIAQ
jgi:hypothetical protein